jgi:AraC family transcriptional regulator
MARGEAPQRETGGGLAPWQLRLASRRLLDAGAVSAEELASLCGLSRSYFTRAFKVSMGLSPHQWLVRQRIGRAAEMLEATQDSISVIALSCGFADQSHLTRRFHATVGVSPAAWRRQRKAGVAPPIAPLAAFAARPDA